MVDYERIEQDKQDTYSDLREEYVSFQNKTDIIMIGVCIVGVTVLIIGGFLA